MKQGLVEHDGTSTESKEHVGLAPRRSFLKLLGSAAVGVFAAVAGSGFRQPEARATHNGPAQEWIHDLRTGPNVVSGVVIKNPEPHAFRTFDPAHAVLEVGRDYYDESSFKGAQDDGDLSPAIRGIRGNPPQSQSYNPGVAIVGHHIGSGTGVAGKALDGTGVVGEGGAIGVAGSGEIGVQGTGGQDELSSGTSGIGLVGLGRPDVGIAEYIDIEVIHYPIGLDEVNTAPHAGGIGVRAIGATGIEGIADDEGGVGVLGSNMSGGRGIVGHSPGGTGVTGAGAVGLHGIALDEHGNVVGQGVVGEGPTGIVGKSSEPGGIGVQGDSSDGVGVEGISQENDGIRGTSTNGDGVRGTSEHAERHGVRGDNAQGEGVRGNGRTGVRGKSADANGIGVAGENANGIGIEGRGRVGIRGVAAGQEGPGGPPGGQSSTGQSGPSLLRSGSMATLVDTELPDHPVAIQGIAREAGSTGIEARAEASGSTAMKVETINRESVALEVKVPEGGTAIHIKGSACFDTVGMGMFAKNTRSVTISDPRVTADSFIYAMITGDPKVGQGTDMVAIQWIDRHPGEGFTVHLNTSIKRETPFSYFVVEPCPPDEQGIA